MHLPGVASLCNYTDYIKKPFGKGSAIFNDIHVIQNAWLRIQFTVIIICGVLESQNLQVYNACVI